jgi:hypothetical protein
VALRWKRDAGRGAAVTRLPRECYPLDLVVGVLCRALLGALAALAAMGMGDRLVGRHAACGRSGRARGRAQVWMGEVLVEAAGEQVQGASEAQSLGGAHGLDVVLEPLAPIGLQRA